MREVRAAGLEGPQRACHPDALELSVMEHGAENALVGGRSVLLGSGEYGLIGPGVEHSSWTTDRSAVEWNIHLPKVELARVADELGVSHDDWSFPSASFAAPSELLAILSAMERELLADVSPARELVMTTLSTYLCAFVLRRHVLADRAASSDDPRSAKARLERVEERMRAAPSDAFSLEELAASAEMSRYHFLRSFKKRYGMPPYAYLTKLRIERARTLMEETDQSLTSIAFEVGFGSSSRLTEAFKQELGCLPSAWRARQGGNFRKAS